MSELLERVEESIGRRGLLRCGQSVLVAVSGGVDSMALLHLLHTLSKKNSWRLSVAYLNHRLRGRSSDADERLVVRTATKLGLPVVVERADVKQFARAQKLSLEMAARKVRHDFLARTARCLKIHTVALAHHADDQLELFFLRLLRGSGGDGLAGMKWRNVSPADARVELIRPLLDQPKAVLEKFAAQHKVRFREDASNASLDIQRNRIRQELLPLLRREYQPALDRTIARVMEIVGAEAELVGKFAEAWAGELPKSNCQTASDAVEGRARQSSARRPQTISGRRARSAAPYQPPFAELPVAVQRRCIQFELLRQKVAPDFELVENLRTRPGHFIKVSPDLAVVLEAGGRLRTQASRIIAAPNPAVCEVDLQADKGEVFGGVKFKWLLVSRRTRQLPKPEAGRESFDADKAGARIILRHWRAGDRFQPSGMKSSVKLQDLFVNGKIPRAERSRLVVAATAFGEIFWVERLRIAERFKLSDTTKRCLQWHWKRL